MFCKNCGAQIDDGAHFCPYCGAATGVGADAGADLNFFDEGRSERSEAAPEKKNGFAVAGLVLALVSILGSMLLSILGIVFSAIGMVHRKDCTRYNGLAKGGLIVSIITFALWIVVIVAVIVAVA